MSNILLTYTTREVTNIMMEEFFSRIVKEQGSQISLKAIKSSCVKRADVEWADIVFAVRPQGVITASLVKIAHAVGKLTATMIDDDFFSIKGIYARKMHGVGAIRKALKYSDVVVSSNDSLLQKLLRYTNNAKGIMIHTGVQDGEIKDSSLKNNKDGLNIAYYSNSNNPKDFETYIKPVLNQLNELYKDKIWWTFFHVHPDLSGTPYKNRVTYISKMSLYEFRERLGDGTYDIGVMPLVDNEFNRSKYVNHFFEYSRAGIPGIYSNVEPYKSFIKNGQNGLLCGNTKEEWLDAFCQMMNSDRRRSLVQNAQDELRRNYSVTAVFNDFIKDFPELISYKSRFKRVHGLWIIKIEDFIGNRVAMKLVWFVHIVVTGHIFSMIGKVVKRGFVKKP